MKELISKDLHAYKANLHCHSTLSDGKKTPQELKEMYRSHGYSVLAITDHEFPKSHSEMNEADFLMLTGYEGYIRVNPNAIFNPFLPEVHLNLFAKEPDNERIICYNPNYGKYTRREKVTRIHAGSERVREYSTEYVNDYIRTARENGYLVSYNHPYWSMEGEQAVLSYEGCFSMEMRNYSSYLSNRLEYNGALYDRLLLAGKRIFCHAGDDNHNAKPPEHPESDSFGAFTMILASELTYPSIIDAMEQGNMYASSGPQIHSLICDGTKFHIECSPAEHIYLYCGSKTPLRVHAEPGAFLAQADFEVNDAAPFVRFTVMDHDGNTADTRGYFRDELGW